MTIPEASTNNPIFSHLHALLALSIFINGYFFWIGTVFVRLYFYRGALGPQPYKIIIIPDRFRQRCFEHDLDADDSNFKKGSSDHPYDDYRDTMISTAIELDRLSQVPTLNVQDADDLEDIYDPKVRAYFTEECRISQLPAFDQDDCGDGSEFRDLPFALEPVETQDTHASTASALERTADHLRLGLSMVDREDWLRIDNAYIEYHSMRDSILARAQPECIQFLREADDACEELLQEVVDFLVTKYPEHFSVRKRQRRRYIRNELTQEDFSLDRPHEHHPLEICARLATEDFQILTRGDFTMQWYLQASATLFPAGHLMRRHLGKSLDAIVNDTQSAITIWKDFPEICRLPAFSPYSFAPSLLRRTEIYIQTRPHNQPTSAHFHMRRPADLFAGQLFDLRPSNLHVRHEHQTFRRLPRSGAMVMSTRTELQKLTDLSIHESRELLKEIEAWDEGAAAIKGRDLWITAVEGYCFGKPIFRDDATVFSFKL
ncbi:hypothetical protein ACN47E_004086 [Coniothyrium glycines]